MNFILTTVKVLMAELVGIGILTGILYLYWNIMIKRKK